MADLEAELELFLSGAVGESGDDVDAGTAFPPFVPHTPERVVVPFYTNLENNVSDFSPIVDPDTDVLLAQQAVADTKRASDAAIEALKGAMKRKATATRVRQRAESAMGTQKWRDAYARLLRALPDVDTLRWGACSTPELELATAAMDRLVRGVLDAKPRSRARTA